MRNAERECGMGNVRITMRIRATLILTLVTLTLTLRFSIPTRIPHHSVIRSIPMPVNSLTKVHKYSITVIFVLQPNHDHFAVCNQHSTMMYCHLLYTGI